MCSDRDLPKFGDSDEGGEVIRIMCENFGADYDSETNTAVMVVSMDKIQL